MRILIPLSLIILMFYAAQSLSIITFFGESSRLVRSLVLSRNYDTYTLHYVIYYFFPVIAGIAIFIIGQIRQWNKHIGEDPQQYVSSFIGIGFIFWGYFLLTNAFSSYYRCLAIADGYGLTSTELINVQNALASKHMIFELIGVLWMCAGALLTATSVYQLFVSEITVNALDETEKIELL